MSWTERKIVERVWERAAGELATWDCPTCGFGNKPRPVMNSLNALPPGHPVFDPAWRESHCEQCGAETTS